MKVFLEASLEVRGERRFQDLDAAKLENSAEVMREMEARDRRDREREESPLVPAADAVHINSTQLTAEQVLEKILGLVEEKSREYMAGYRGK